MFNLFKKTVENSKPEIVITEGIGGTFYYHFSEKKKFIRSLCGKKTMTTALPVSSWGIKTHLNERYCEECFKLTEIL